MAVNKLIITFTLSIFIQLNVFCREVPDSSSQTINNHLFFNRTISLKENEKIPDFSSLIFSFDYSTNTNTFGNFNNEIKQPYYSPSVSYFSKYGFDLSILPSFIKNSDATLSESTSELDLMAGYNFQPLKNLSIYPGYTHIFYSENSYSLKSVISDIAQLDLSYQLKWYNASLSSSYLMGEKNTFYFSVQNSFSIDFERVPGKNALLSLQPGIDLNISDKNYYNDILISDYLNSPVINYLVQRWLNRFPNLTEEQIKDRLYNLENPDAFNVQYALTSVSLILPIYYMIGDFSFNLTFYTSIPVYQSDFLSSDVQFYLNAGISYSIDFQK
jgi:hypothetical protein